MPDFVERLLGLHVQAKDLEFGHMAWRSLVVFCVAVALARIGDRRFMGRSAGYDFMLAIILGSVLSRAINGQASFFPTLGASVLLVVLHRVAGALAFHSHLFSVLLKGRVRVLVRHGTMNEREMRRSHVTPDDLLESLRLNGNITELEEVEEARLERNGSVSVIKRSR